MCNIHLCTAIMGLTVLSDIRLSIRQFGERFREIVC